MNIKKSIINTILITPIILASPSSFSAVPHTFSSGTSAKASEVNSNFSSLDQRISALEANINKVDVAVDCTTDANALINTDLKNGVSYVLTGMCNGPINIVGNRSITIKGDANGIKNDGIMLPAGLLTHPNATVGAYGTNQLFLENLTISAENYNTITYSFGTYVSAINAGNGARVKLTDIDVKGGDVGVLAYRQSTIDIHGATTVSGFSFRGLFSNSNGYIVAVDAITITGLSNSVSDFGVAAEARRGSTLEVKNGGTFTPPSGSSMTETHGFYSADSSSIQIYKPVTGTTTVNGGSGSSYTSSIESTRSSALRIEGATLNGNVSSGNSSSMRVIDSAITANRISTYRNGSAEFKGTTDLGGTNISCSAGSVKVSGTVTNKGLVCGL